MSSEVILLVSVEFNDPVLDGGDLSEIAKYYRPLLRVESEYMTSCYFDRIGSDRGVMVLGLPYEVTIKLPMASEMEAFFGKSIQEIFPEGRIIELLAGDKVVAKGRYLRVSGRS